MATYQIFKKVKQKTEGYFARLKNDTGGMTYQGIARNFHPNWDGWPIIDFQLITNPRITDSQLSTILKANTYLESLVDDFYIVLWNRIGAGVLSQDLADLYMDWYIHKPADSVRAMQRLLNSSFGENLSVDGVPGPATNAAVRKHDSVSLYNKYREARLASYKSQKYSSPTFWSSWVARVNNNFPSKITNPLSLLASVIVLGLGTFAIIKLNMSSDGPK